MTRSFLLLLPLAATLLLLASPGCVTVEKHEHHKHHEHTHAANPYLGRVRHVVLFRFKPDADPAAIRKVERDFAALPSQIPQIRDFEWGTNHSPEGLDQGYTHAFLLTFDSTADRDAYLPHPAHKAFASQLGPILDAVHVIDYTAAQ